MKDLYNALGVPKTASHADIKSAYRKLAKKYHPDANPGDKSAEQRFKEVSAAYSILGDEEKRRQYDTGVIDAEGVKRAEQEFYRAYETNPGGFRSAFSSGGGINIDDIFAEFFGSSRRRNTGGGRQAFKQKGADVSYNLKVSFIEAANGVKKRVSLGGKMLDINIPAGATDGQSLRLRGQGQSGTGGGPDGDAYIEIQVESHPFFTRKGQDIHVNVPVTLSEALNGASITVPTLSGKVNVKVPAGASSGTLLRLKGKGIEGVSGPTGDQYVRLEIALPPAPDAKLKEAAAAAEKKAPYDPRQKAGLY